MNAISALDTEIHRVLRESTEIQADFGNPVRLVAGETARAAFPYIRLARHEIRPRGPSGEDSPEHRISLEVFSRSGGREEGMRLTGLIGEILRQAELSPSGYRLILFFPVFSDVFLRSDGTTFRGLLRLRALSEKV
jgi:hypothetical protein